MKRWFIMRFTYQILIREILIFLLYLQSNDIVQESENNYLKLSMQINVVSKNLAGKKGRRSNNYLFFYLSKHYAYLCGSFKVADSHL